MTTFDTAFLFITVAIIAALVSWAVAHQAIARARSSQSPRSPPARNQPPVWVCDPCDRPFPSREAAHDHALEAHNAPAGGDQWEHLFDRRHSGGEN